MKNLQGFENLAGMWLFIKKPEKLNI